MSDSPKNSQNDNNEETFISHLVELRTRLVRAAIAVFVVFVSLVYWSPDIFRLLARLKFLRGTKFDFIGWTAERHHFAGNVGLADGSVQQFDSRALKAAVVKSGATNHLLML